jgi:hypothetical protein
MSWKNRMKILVLGLFVGFATTMGAGVLGYATAHGDSGSAAIAAPPADTHALPAPALTGSGSDVAPADKLHDPLAAPIAAFDDVLAAKKLGWPILVLVALILISRVLARVGGVFKPLGSGKAALGIAAVGTFAITAYNAVALGGSWFAAVTAAVVAGFAAWDAGAKTVPKAQ